MNTEKITFATGQLLSSMFVSSEMKLNGKFAIFCQASLDKHKSGDWGDLEEEDKEANDFALENNDRLFSAYLIPKDVGIKEEEKIYIITEYDRSCTTILFPMEY